METFHPGYGELCPLYPSRILYISPSAYLSLPSALRYLLLPFILPTYPASPPLQDALLLEAVKECTIYRKTKWVEVAAHVGGGKTNVQCRERYVRYLNPALQLLNNEPWTEDESKRLNELVQQQKQQQQKHSVAGNKIDWVSIGSELHRNPIHCQNRWSRIQACLLAKSLNTGPFTPEEDAVIIERVAAVGAYMQGLWRELETELGQPAISIFCRWRDTLSKR